MNDERQREMPVDLEILTSDEIRAWLKISKRTLSRWIADGRLPVQVAPSRWTRRQIEVWLSRFDEQNASQKPFEAI